MSTLYCKPVRYIVRFMGKKHKLTHIYVSVTFERPLGPSGICFDRYQQGTFGRSPHSPPPDISPFYSFFYGTVTKRPSERPHDEHVTVL
jgi:hypothetical protein